MKPIWFIIALCLDESIAKIVLICHLKHSDVGHGHFETCETSKPAIDTSTDKIIDTAIGWSKSRTTNDVQQYYTEYVNCVHFPFDLNTVFPNLEVIRLWKSNVKFVDNMDLRNLVNLKIFDLEDNNIEVLQSDLFINNIKLKEIYLQKNKLKFIAARVFNVINLIALNLEENLCVNGKAYNDISAMLTLKLKVDEICSAPEFLLTKNEQLIKNIVDLNYTLTEESKKRGSLDIEYSKAKSSLTTCEDERSTIQNDKFRLNSQIKKDANYIKKLNDELKSVKELNNDLTSENVKLTNQVKKLSLKLKDSEEKVYDLITNNRACTSESSDSLKERTLKYENEKLSKEIRELKSFKNDLELEWRIVSLECQFVIWNNVYTCQTDKLKVKIDDAEVVVVGKHVKGKKSSQVKKLVINSEDVKMIFLPINLGTVFEKIQSIIIQNSNLISIKIENFDNMKELKEILLDYNDIEEIPFDTFTYPVNLERLSLGHNKIKYLNKDLFKELKKLKYLFANDNKIQKINSELLKFNNKLEIVNLQNNNIKHIGLNAFKTLNKLILINLENNQCISVKYNLEQLNKETNMIISKCSSPETQDIDCQYENFDSIYTCSIIDIRIESDNILISNIEGNHLLTNGNDNVKQLKAYNQDLKFFPTGFSNFYKNVEKIDVKNSQLVGIGENEFIGLIKVKELILSSNNINNLHENSFKDLKNLEILNLSNNQITKLPNKVFEQLTSLKTLDISTNKIQKLPTNLLAKNINLEILNASGNKLSQIHSALLNRKVKLKEANFNSNSCINARMPHISLDSLILLFVENCSQIDQ
ncbi:hypothetical protein ACKWTF_004243 [Chironomus riparius]